MSYKYSSGYQVMGDISGSDDANRNTGIDFEEDAIYLVTNGTERFRVSGSNGTVTFNGAFTFPATDGQNNQVLQTNGSGQLSWNSVTGGEGGGGDGGLTVVSPKTGNYTASNNEVVPVNLIGASGDVTITLPAASSNAQVIVKISGNAEGKTVTVDGNSSQTIDGSATRTMDSDNESMFLISDGFNWLRIS
jgi:hypothetical protein